MKRLLLIISCLCVLIAVERLHNFQNGGFRASKLVSSLTPHLDPAPPEIDALLNQRFHYFGKGGTSFVFLGEDQKTVLKLFKHQHLFSKKHAHKHHTFFFGSCKLAFDHLQKETGLIYLCLRPNPHFSRSVQLIDTWGFAHTIDLSQTEFAIQKKAEPFFPHLEHLLKTGQTENGKRAIDALLKQMRTRCNFCIGNRDPNLLINFGFIEGEAIEFDLGSYFPDPRLKNPLLQAKEIFFATHTLQKWLEKHSPELLNYLLENIHTE